MFIRSRILIPVLAFALLFALAPLTGGTPATLAQTVASVSCSSLPSGSSTCTVTLNTNIRAGGSVTAVLQNGGATFSACTASSGSGQTCAVSNTNVSATLTCGDVDCQPGSQFQEMVAALPTFAQQQFFLVTSASGVIPPPAATTAPVQTTTLTTPVSSGGGLCANGSIRTAYGCTSLSTPLYSVAGYGPPSYGYNGYLNGYGYGYPYTYPYGYGPYLPGYGYTGAYNYLPGSNLHYCVIPGRGGLWVPAGTIVGGVVC